MTEIQGLDMNWYQQRKNQKFQDRNYIRNFEALKKQFVKKQINGDIHMSEAQIKQLGEPKNDDEAATKLYADSISVDINNKINNCVKYNNPEWRSIKNIRTPIHRHDAISKFYLALFYFKDDTNLQKLIQIAEVLKGVIDGKKEHNILFFQEFCICLKKSSKLIQLYNEALDKRNEEKNSRDLWQYSMTLVELKGYIIYLLENLNQQIFIDVKAGMMKEGLITQTESDAEESAKYPFRRFRKFINKQSKIIDPDRSNSDLELLIQKNLLILDLGYVYVIEELLNILIT